MLEVQLGTDDTLVTLQFVAIGYPSSLILVSYWVIHRTGCYMHRSPVVDLQYTDQLLKARTRTRFRFYFSNFLLPYYWQLLIFNDS